MKSESNQTVFVTPVFEDNPYQTRLNAAMREQGRNVIEHLGDMNWFQAAIDAQPQVIHFHWPSPICFAKTKLRTILKSRMFVRRLAALKKQGIKLVWTCHNLGNHQGLWLDLEQKTMRRASRYFDRIIVHHEEAISRAVPYFKVHGGSSKFRVVHHANYLDDYPGQDSRAEARDRLGLNHDEAVLLMLGGLRPQKGIDRLIRVFKKIQPGDLSLRLVLAGAPAAEFREELTALVAGDPRIDLHDRYLSNDEVQQFHRAADIAMLPYSSGLTSGALILAMGFGLPVVCGDFAGAKTDVDQHGGVMVSDNRPETLRKAIETMLASRSQWAAMGAHNHQVVKDQTWQAMASQTIACYDEVC